MILPTKRITQHQALLTIGGDVLALLNTPRTVSYVWRSIKERRSALSETETLTYDWFILALDLLNILGLVEFRNGRLRKVRS